MDVLSSVFGIEAATLEEYSNLADNSVDQDKNVFENYILESKYDRSDVPEQNLEENLEKLNEKHELVKITLEKVIPSLREYLLEFNGRLSEFTVELGLIKNKSSELKNLLQENSSKLSNISPLVNDLMISPNVIDSIISGKIDASWQDNIAFIRDKQEIFNRYQDSESGLSTAVPKDFARIREILNNLKTIILERSKKFIIHKIKLLRNPIPVPSQRIQKELLQVRDMFSFMADNNHELAVELRQAYIYTMKWYYKNYFARYIRSLTILQFKNIDSQYFLGNGLSGTSINYLNGYSISNYLSTSYTKATGLTTDESIQEYFRVDKRLSSLTKEDNTVMVSQIAENNTTENYIEVGFKNLNLAILDNSAVEYNFLKQFFLAGDNDDGAKGLLEKIFEPTMQASLEYTKQILVYTYDMFGVLICIRIAQQLQLEAQEKQIEAISDLTMAQLIILWPKFQQLVTFQCDSLRNLSIAALFSSGDSDYLSKPHEITLQFSNFMCSLMILAATRESDVDDRSEPLYNSIIRMRNDFNQVMKRCSNKTKKPNKFLATNYMYLYNVFQQQHLRLQDSVGDRLPLILQETEEHYLTLVHACNDSS